MVGQGLNFFLKTQQVGVSGEGAKANYTRPPPALAEKTEPLSHLE